MPWRRSFFGARGLAWRQPLELQQLEYRSQLSPLQQALLEPQRQGRLEPVWQALRPARALELPQPQAVPQAR